MRKKLLTVLGEYGKAASIIDDISIVRRYSSDLSRSIPVSSDDEALSKTRKEVLLCHRGGKDFHYSLAHRSKMLCILTGEK